MRILIPDAQFAGEPSVETEASGRDATFEVYRGVPQSAISDASWRTCDAVICYQEAVIDAATVDTLERCRIIVRAGVGFDNVDLDACADRDIPVCNVPDYGTTDVADHAIALLLTLVRGTAAYDAALRRDPVAQWRVDTAPLVRRLAGRRFGVVGLGRIGLATGFRARAFGLDVGFYDPYLPPGHEIALGFRRYPSLDALVGVSEILSIHAPLTDETRGMIGRSVFDALPPGSILINTARGAIVDLDALFDALRNGKVAGAGLDVLPVEPPVPEHPLIRAWRAQESWLAGRLVLSPHAAYYSAASLADLRRKSAETAVGYLRDGRLSNCVNRERLKRRSGRMMPS